MRKGSILIRRSEFQLDFADSVFGATGKVRGTSLITLM